MKQYTSQHIVDFFNERINELTTNDDERDALHMTMNALFAFDDYKRDDIIRAFMYSMTTRSIENVLTQMRETRRV